MAKGEQKGGNVPFSKRLEWGLSNKGIQNSAVYMCKRQGIVDEDLVQKFFFFFELYSIRGLLGPSG